MINRLNSIVWKLIIPTGVILVVALVVIGIYINNNIKDIVHQSAVDNAVETANQYKRLRKYYTENIIQPVLNSGGALKPSINHSGNNEFVPLPATMIHDLSKLSKDTGTKLSLYSDYPFPNRKNRVLDDFQTRAWSFLSKNPTEVMVEETEVNGRNILRVAIADLMVAQNCVGCHNSHPDTPKNDWKLSDVRGVLEVETDTQDVLSDVGSTSSIIIVLLLLASAFVTFAIYLVFNRFVGVRLGQLNRSLIYLGSDDGDLTKRVDEVGNDEISDIAKNFNSFLGGLHKVVSNVSEAATNVQRMSQEIKGATDVAIRSATEQQENTGSVAAAMNEMAESVQAVSENAVNGEDAAKEAANESEKGQHIVEETIAAINSLADEVVNTGKAIQTLENDSSDIGSVLDVIKGIAEQTNLLALNAAIEAARAGEQGRGFAVVADEVRSLASRTQESTKEIEQMIERLQNGSKNAVKTTMQSKDKADDCVSYSEKAGESLALITEAVKRISELNTEIAHATTEQSKTTVTVEESISEVNDIANNAVDSASDSVKRSDELLDVADTLKRQVNRFKL